MKFTHEHPTKPGWYWLYFPGDRKLVATEVKPAEQPENGLVAYSRIWNGFVILDRSFDKLKWGVDPIPEPSVE